MAQWDNYVDKHRVIIQWSKDDDAFVCAIPSLPGCMADGPTREQALQNLNRVAELWIEQARSMGRTVPAPEREVVLV